MLNQVDSPTSHCGRFQAYDLVTTIPETPSMEGEVVKLEFVGNPQILQHHRNGRWQVAHCALRSLFTCSSSVLCFNACSPTAPVDRVISVAAVAHFFDFEPRAYTASVHLPSNRHSRLCRRETDSGQP